MDGLVASVNESPFLMVDETSYEPEVDTIDLSREFQVQQASEVSPHVLLVTFEFQAIVSLFHLHIFFRVVSTPVVKNRRGRLPSWMRIGMTTSCAWNQPQSTVSGVGLPSTPKRKKQTRLKWKV